MPCLRCGETRKESSLHTFRRTIDGFSFVAEAEVDACARCRDVQVPVALLVAFERAVAADLARRGPVSGDTFRFLRKAIPLQPVEVSRLLGVPLETVNRWEAGRRSIDLAPWLVVATIALEAFEGPSPMFARIRALRETPSPQRVVELRRDARRTLRDVLDLLAGPVVLTDLDIADALGAPAAVLRTRLGELARAGLVERTEVDAAGAGRWEPREPDASRLVQRARDAGIDVDAVLPAAEPDSGHGPRLARTERVVAMTWRATS